MIDDATMAIIQNVMDTHPESEWVDAVKKAVPVLDEKEIIEMVMFLNINDVVDLAE